MPVLSNNGRLISSLPITSTIVGQDELLLQSSGITKRINYATLSSSILSSTNFSPFNATVNFTSATNKGTLQLPSFDLIDAGVSYKWDLANTTESVKFRLNVNNLLDTVYIAESNTNIFADDFVSGTTGPTYASAGRLYNGVATGNQVFFGFGRTWNFSLSYNF